MELLYEMVFLTHFLALELKDIEYEYKAVHLVKGGGQQVLNANNSGQMSLVFL